jgi:hypothetical protein
MAPVLERARPDGRTPLAGVVEKVYGDCPPLAERDWLYAESAVPDGSVAGITVMAGAVMVIVAVAADEVPIPFVAV